MKYSLLLFMSLFVFAIACGQQYEEVEFAVKKKADKWHRYIYTDSASPGSSGGLVLVAGLYRNTVVYEAKISAERNDTSYTGIRSLKLKYETQGDTIYANIYTGNNVPPSRVCVFVKNGIAVNAYPIASKLFPPFQDQLSTVYDAGRANVTVGDSTYSCYKLVEAIPFVQQGYWLRIKAARFFRYRRNMLRLSVQYIRESDFLPIKIATVAPVKQYKPGTALREDEVTWLLRKND